MRDGGLSIIVNITDVFNLGEGLCKLSTSPTRPTEVMQKESKSWHLAAYLEVSVLGVGNQLYQGFFYSNGAFLTAALSLLSGGACWRSYLDALKHLGRVPRMRLSSG